MLRNTRVKLSENVLQDDKKKKKKKKEKEKKDTKDKKGALKEYVYDSSIISLAGKWNAAYLIWAVKLFRDVFGWLLILSLAELMHFDALCIRSFTREFVLRAF